MIRLVSPRHYAMIALHQLCGTLLLTFMYHWESTGGWEDTCPRVQSLWMSGWWGWPDELILERSVLAASAAGLLPSSWECHPLGLITCFIMFQATPDLLKGQQELTQQTNEETAKQILYNYLKEGCVVLKEQSLCHFWWGSWLVSEALYLTFLSCSTWAWASWGFVSMDAAAN